MAQGHISLSLVPTRRPDTQFWVDSTRNYFGPYCAWVLFFVSWFGLVYQTQIYTSNSDHEYMIVY
jgi:hypothetical protein